MTHITEVASPAAVATAEWWAGHVFGGTVGDSGGGFETLALAIVAGAQGVAAPASKREQFVAQLAAYIDAALIRMARPDDTRYEPMLPLGCDYGPEPALGDIARDLGINGGSFPWKTNTWTRPSHVTASLGYGGASTLVWQAEDWDRPVCGAGKYDGPPEYDRLPWKCSALIHHDGEHVFDVPDPLCQATIVGGFSDGPCRRSADHEWHRESDYPSRSAHEFVA